MSEIREDLIDELLKGYEKPEDIVGESGLLKLSWPPERTRQSLV